MSNTVIKREQWWLSNIGSLPISVGLDFVPIIKPGQIIDLLQYASKEDIGNSPGILEHIQANRAVITKYKDGILTETVTLTNVLDALTIAEKSLIDNLPPFTLQSVLFTQTFS